MEQQCVVVGRLMGRAIASVLREARMRSEACAAEATNAASKQEAVASGFACSTVYIFAPAS